MIGLSNLFEEIENCIENEQNRFQHVGQGIIMAVKKGPGNVEYRYREKNEREGENDDPKILMTYQPVDIIRQQAIFDDIEKIEVELGDPVQDLVIVAIN
jgi:hypothetical protein